ncbi:hypothetical protein BKA70DRAFT_1507764 [Coprinopsis sp. MPI-PUGE-AT-0042]|nr:hypothetical protein BKA70DRAFT_1507764 [Coprinopsis sp. MPI-PUGE-AT-0042]
MGVILVRLSEIANASCGPYANFSPSMASASSSTSPTSPLYPHSRRRTYPSRRWCSSTPIGPERSKTRVFSKALNLPKSTLPTAVTSSVAATWQAYPRREDLELASYPRTARLSQCLFQASQTRFHVLTPHPNIQRRPSDGPFRFHFSHLLQTIQTPRLVPPPTLKQKSQNPVAPIRIRAQRALSSSRAIATTDSGGLVITKALPPHRLITTTDPARTWNRRCKGDGDGASATGMGTIMVVVLGILVALATLGLVVDKQEKGIGRTTWQQLKYLALDMSDRPSKRPEMGRGRRLLLMVVLSRMK